MSHGRSAFGNGQRTPSGTSRSSSVDPERSAAPGPDPSQDQHIDAKEKAALGFSAAPVSLKPPPSAKVPLQLVKRVLESSSGGTSANLSRAKRPKTIKFSPAKANNKTARVQSSSKLASTVEHAHTDEDHCVVCGQEGKLLICDTCNLGYHFACLDPPISEEQTPQEAWHCKPCEAKRVPHSKHKQRFFGALLDRLDFEPPQTFTPPKFIVNSFDNILANSNGEYTDPTAFKPPRLNKAGFSEPVDPFKLKDRQGRFAFCFSCHKAASSIEQKRIVGCDYCDKHWHLDCLEPPLAILPYSQSGRKWMCPLHADHNAPPMRKLRPERTVKVLQRNVANNGNVTVIPREKPKKRQVRWDEQLHRGIRYQVPEDTLILDFWAKVRDPDRKILNQRRLARQLGEHEAGEDSDSSDLTSLDSSDSETDKPAAPGTHNTSKGRKKASLDSLQLSGSAAAAKTVKPQNSPLPLDDRIGSGTPSVAGSDGDMHAVASTSRETLNATSMTSRDPSSDSPRDLPASQTSAKAGQGQEPAAQVHAKIDGARTRRASARHSAVGGTSTPPTEAPPEARKSIVNSTPQIPELSDAKSSSTAHTSNGNGDTSALRSGSQQDSTSGSPAGPHTQLKVRLAIPNRDRDKVSAAAEARPAKRAKIDQISHNNEEEVAPSTIPPPSPHSNGNSAQSSRLADATQEFLTSGLLPEDSEQKPNAAFSLQSKDDLKALLKARQILHDTGYADQQTNLFNFLFSEVPRVPQVQGLQRTPGWNVPWGS